MTTLNLIFLLPTQSYLFIGLSKLEGNYIICLKEGAKPFSLSTPRKVSLLKPVREELDRMARLGVISQINEPTD